MKPERNEELKVKYGKLYQIGTTAMDETGDDIPHEFIFKAPGAKAYDRFLKDAAKKTTQAMKNLILDGVIDEDKERLTLFLDTYPAGAAPIAQQYLKVMGHTDDANLKVL